VTPRLHVVTDDAVLALPEFTARAEAVLQRIGRDVALHLRAHATPARSLHAIAAQLAAAALRSGAWLIVNDRADIAMAVRANGVQLGRRSIDIPDAKRLLGQGARIGYSAHAPQEAANAAGLGADWIFAGSIWATSSHAEREPAGLELLCECVRHANAPVLAIGGVTPERVRAVAQAGGHGVAVLGGVWHSADAAAAAAQYVDAVHEAWQGVEAE